MKYTMIKEMRPEQRPDEKFLTFGPAALTDAELLAIILRTGTKEEPSVELAQRVLQNHPDKKASILNIIDYAFEDLQKIKGIGPVKALQIKAVAELSKRIATTRAFPRIDFSDPQTVAEYYMEQLRHSEKEQVILVMLNTACRMICDKTIFIGTVNSALFSPREIYLEAMKHEAVHILLLHNHPSGDPRPSRNDIMATKRVEKAGELIGITLLDHIIIGDRVFTSLRKEGIFEKSL